MPPTLQVIQNQLNNYQLDVPVLASIKNALPDTSTARNRTMNKLEKAFAMSSGRRFCTRLKF
jgi:hypothetical protein